MTEDKQATPPRDNEVRLVAMTEEQAAHLSFIREHPDNDLSPNDEQALHDLAHGFDSGITVDDVKRAGAVVNGPDPKCGCGICRLDRLLSSAFPASPDTEEESDE